MLGPELEGSCEIQSFSGKKIGVDKVESKAGKLLSSNMLPDLVISNNDFSNPYAEVDFSQTLMTPMRELGWYQRKKHDYFNHYNEGAGKFAKMIGEDPWLFQVKTGLFQGFEVGEETSRKELGVKVDQILQEVQEKYDQHGIKEKPKVFIKNNSGTYGLGVITATSGKDIQAWNYKSKKKMKASKGGGGIQEVIIQEAVPTILTEEGATAEPVLYMIGPELAGGFLRTHNQKGATESLNSPGAVYKRLCLTDLKVKAQGCVLENVYGWMAKLGFLAISQESYQTQRKGTSR